MLRNRQAVVTVEQCKSEFRVGVCYELYFDEKGRIVKMCAICMFYVFV